MKRAVALVLLLVFFGGESGLPLMDAVLEHRSSTHMEGRAHLETAGNPQCHAESCVLALATVGSQQTASAVGPSITAAISVAPFAPGIPSSPPRPVLTDTHFSRAPPRIS